MHRDIVFESNSTPYTAFPLQDVILSIRVAVLDTGVTYVLVSAIFSKQGLFTLLLSSNVGHLLTFVYKGSLWLKARSDAAFGFLKLKHVPKDSFKYIDKNWKLSKNCFTTPIRRKGLHSIYVNGIKLPLTEILLLRTGGLVETLSLIISDSVIVNIGRSKQCTDGYYLAPKNTLYYISNINRYSVRSLNIKSSDSTITIKGPLPISDNVYALYIKTLEGFPICSLWFDDEEQPYSRKLSYLECTGTQYIDTGILPDFAGGDEVSITFVAGNNPAVNNIAFGSRTTAARNGFYYMIDQRTSPIREQFVACDAQNWDLIIRTEASFSLGDKLTITANDNLVSVTGPSYQWDDPMPRRVTSLFPVYLFVLNDGGVIFQRNFYSGMKLYEWKYWRNGTLAQHLIPVLDKSGVPCLFDEVTRTFKYNAGTGTFNYA